MGGQGSMPNGSPIPDILEYKPVSLLKVRETRVEKARYPAIDIHNHLLFEPDRTPEQYLEIMNSAGVERILDLTGNLVFKGSLPDRAVDKGSVQETQKEFALKYPDRFSFLTMSDLAPREEGNPKIDSDFGERAAAELEEDVKRSAKGLKVLKDLGLRIKDSEGKLVPADDPRLDPLWEKCAELEVPVLIHTADPDSFFNIPPDRFNEEVKELITHPDWSFSKPEFPIKEALLQQRDNLLRNHPQTIFVGAHLGSMSNDLASLGRTLDEYPNFFVDTSARGRYIGRQPRTAREFFLKYRDRILFGTDSSPSVDTYRIWWRLLETEDEYFDPPEADYIFWKVYGLGLPDDVLRRVYRDNAMRIFEF